MAPRNNLRVVLFLTAGLLAACKGASYWSDQVQADPLYQRSGKVRTGAACGKLVPMEFGQTVPIPVRDGFKVLFYPTNTSPGRSEVQEPMFEGFFARDGAAPDRCAKVAGAGSASRGPAVRPGVSQSEYYREEAQLYAALDKTAEMYVKGDPLSPESKKSLTDFLDAFAVIGEPGLTAEYYRASPDFWEWLRKEAGRSIPKA
ncbi:MAG: hypothetical protein KGJ84_13885 [Elusimicrobia bacterium]|nr:hypothetical protein [Elusimicrobiota bacterium]